jgi:peptidoglycan/xylan/chitin deacetylase (PgdA/CDA1 family)
LRWIRWLLAALVLVVITLSLGAESPVYVGAEHVSRGNGCRRVVALTFDDGPNPPYTERIVRLLQEKDARATFFVEGEAAQRDPADVRLLRDTGMMIASHSYSHSEQLRTMTEEQFRADLESATVVFQNILDYAPRLYRAPFGKMSAAMIGELRRAGYVSIGWDVDSDDWQETNPGKIAAKVLSEVHPGAIVLLHDGGLSGGNPDRSGTLAALPAIIDGLRGGGYRLVTVPEILDPRVCSASLR